MSLFLYILLSASLITAWISWPSSLFVAVPIEMLKIAFSPAVFLLSAFILFIISSVSLALVLGSSTTNSSPPHLAMMSSFLHTFFSNSAAFLIILSPSVWPKVSFIILSPFKSPIINPRGSCRLVSSLKSSSSKYALLYKPVSLSWKERCFSFSSCFFFSVMSLKIITAPLTLPSLLFIGAELSVIFLLVPSLEIKTGSFSNSQIFPVASTSIAMSFNFFPLVSLIRLKTSAKGLPKTSSDFQPVSCSATEFM